MEKLKGIYEKIKYHFLRLPIIRSIVKWMYNIFEIEGLKNYHVADATGHKQRKTICRIDFSNRRHTIRNTALNGDEVLRIALRDRRRYCGTCMSHLYGDIEIDPFFKKR